MSCACLYYSSILLGEGIGLVISPKVAIVVPCSRCLFYSHLRLRKQYSLASPSTCRVSFFLPCHLHIHLHVFLTFKPHRQSNASYDALVNLFASFENFLSILSIYTGIPPMPALTNVLVKIIVKLLSTLAAT